MVASRELQAGEEIVTEMPFIIGPKACTYPLCLSCYTPWPPGPGNKPLCSKCRWPVCDQECENASQHKDYECQVSVKRLELKNFSNHLEIIFKSSSNHLQILRKAVTVNLSF